MTYFLFQTFHKQLSLIINRFDIMNSVRRHYWLWWMNKLRRYQISKYLYSTFYLSIINAESSVLVVCTGLGTVKIDLKLIMNENKLSQLDLGTLCLESLHPKILHVPMSMKIFKDKHPNFRWRDHIQTPVCRETLTPLIFYQ